MKSIITSLAFGLLCLSALGAESTPRYFSAKPGALTKAKSQLAAGDKQLAKALKKLVKDADKALATPSLRVAAAQQVRPASLAAAAAVRAPELAERQPPRMSEPSHRAAVPMVEPG